MAIESQEFYSICLEKLDKALKMSRDRNIWIYGAGRGGRILMKVLQSAGISFKGFSDKNADNIKSVENYHVVNPSSLNPEKDFLFISLMSCDTDSYSELMMMGFTPGDMYAFSAGYEDGYSNKDVIYKGCKIGRYTYGYKDLMEWFSNVVSIGRYCSIAPTARVVDNHSTECISAHPFLDHPWFHDWEEYVDIYNYTEKYGKNRSNHWKYGSKIRNNKSVTIGNDVWIGSNVIILPGTHIGDGAIIAAGAVVNDDVDDYAIVGGIPAHTIKYRFDQDIIRKLLEIRWWDWDENKIKNNMELFYQPEMFVKQFLSEC